MVEWPGDKLGGPEGVGCGKHPHGSRSVDARWEVGLGLRAPIPARVDCGEEDALIPVRAPDGICSWSWDHDILQGEGHSLGPFAPSHTSMVAMPGAWGTGSGVC